MECSTGNVWDVVLGRMFNHHVLDMIELGIDHMKPMQEFQVRQT